MAEPSEILASAPEDLTVKVTLKVSTGKDDETAGTKKATKEFSSRLPKDIHSAIKLLGERTVFRMFSNALVVDLQGEERQRLKPETGKTRVKASYLQQLGL